MKNRSKEMLRAIIIDDEQECINSLKFDLKKYCPEVNIIDSCNNGKEGIKAINQKRPDIVFLDIDMPFINGFDVIEMVPNIDFEVIFTTAYDKFALKAFQISAVDYLLKPIEPESLKKSVKKVQYLKEYGNPKKQISYLLQQIKDIENNTVKKVALPTFDGIDLVSLDEIIYCQSDGAYSYIYFSDGSKLYISKTLRYLEEVLCDYDFLRVHNSYIVNIEYVRKYAKTDGGYLIMKDGSEVRVSRSKKDELMKIFKN